MRYSSRNIDEEGTRAAARALYGPVDRAIYVTMRSEVPLADLIAESQAVPAVRLRPLGPPTERPAGESVPHPVAPLPAPRRALTLSDQPADQIEAILRSAPQVCATCKLLSNEPLRDCTSPRGHYFITDYPAIAAKVRDFLGR